VYINTKAGNKLVIKKTSLLVIYDNNAPPVYEVRKTPIYLVPKNIETFLEAFSYFYSS
jgi:hypothetical protein